jgi:hypothetical protein
VKDRMIVRENDEARHERHELRLLQNVISEQPLTPSPSPARGEGNKGFDHADGLIPHRCACAFISPLSPCGRGVGGEGAHPCWYTLCTPLIINKCDSRGARV